MFFFSFFFFSADFCWATISPDCSLVVILFWVFDPIVVYLTKGKAFQMENLKLKDDYEKKGMKDDAVEGQFAVFNFHIRV